MQVSIKNLPNTFHMSLVEPIVVLVLSLSGISLSVSLYVTGAGDVIKMILLLVISLYGVFVALTMTRKLEIARSELIISYLLSKSAIAREEIDSYFLDEQGVNQRTRKFVTIHLANGRRIKFKAIQEGNDALLKALEDFTGFKPANDLNAEPG